MLIYKYQLDFTHVNIITFNEDVNLCFCYNPGTRLLDHYKDLLTVFMLPLY